jgi:predicted nucleotidyltransferase
MIHLPPDFKDFLKLLNDNHVEYLLIGGYAVGYYGYPRATGDMDVWIAVNALNAKNIVQALQQFGFPASHLSEELFLSPNRVLRIGMPPLRIEILTSIDGVDFSECYPESTVETIDGIEVRLISLRRLKENKKSSGRYKDLNDLENLP